MQTILLLTALIGISFSGECLAVEKVDGLFTQATLIRPTLVEEVAVPVVIDEPVAVERIEEVVVEAEEPESAPEELQETEEVAVPVVIDEPVAVERIEEVVAEAEEPESAPEELQETEEVIVAPVEPIVEKVATEELTYDQIHQRDVGEVEEPVAPEVAETWYMEEAANSGLELILATYAIPDFSFLIETTPSNYVYQYEFYADSPDGGHVNLIGIFQYDATGQRTFHLDPVTGLWE